MLPHRIKANTREGSVLPFCRIPTNKCSKTETESLGKHTVTTVQTRSTDGCYSWRVTVPGETGLYSLKALAAVTKREAVTRRSCATHHTVGRDFFQLPDGLNPRTRADGSMWKCPGPQPGMTTEQKALLLGGSNLAPPLL